MIEITTSELQNSIVALKHTIKEMDKLINAAPYRMSRHGFETLESIQKNTNYLRQTLATLESKRTF